jgi:hypothetical protein
MIALVDERRQVQERRNEVRSEDDEDGLAQDEPAEELHRPRRAILPLGREQPP